MVRVASLLNDMPLERANRLFAHPLTQDAYGWVTQFLVELRGCTSYPEYVKFQDGLLARVLEVQGHWEECRRVAHQLGKGKPVPVGAPDLLSGDDANDPESWAVENAVCERVDRHLRSIADAMAWRVFNFDRRAIVALSRNQHPGPMVGRAGLAAEREFVAEWSARDDCFVVLNDLASCLRIGDATLFRSVGQGYEPELRGLPTLAGFRGRAQGLGLTRRFVSARQRWTVGFQTRPYSVGTRAALSRFSYPSRPLARGARRLQRMLHVAGGHADARVGYRLRPDSRTQADNHPFCAPRAEQLRIGREASAQRRNAQLCLVNAPRPGERPGWPWTARFDRYVC